MGSNRNRYDRFFAYGEPDTGRFTGPQHAGSGRDYGRTRDREARAERPWVGGYREGYQGGSGGVPTRASGRGGRAGGDLGRTESRAYDYDHGQGSYDRWYREFDAATRPRFSPVGGMHPAMGGSYVRQGERRPLGYDRWFNEWTRWF
ncbi:hypothetical protein BH24GEM3_BH24GEM3_02910 [soil metagenome]